MNTNIDEAILKRIMFKIIVLEQKKAISRAATTEIVNEIRKIIVEEVGK